MALSQTGKSYVGSGAPKTQIYYDITGANGDTGAFILAHAEGALPTRVVLCPLVQTGAVYLVETLASRTTTNVVITLGAAAVNAFTYRVYIDFEGNDSPVVT